MLVERYTDVRTYLLISIRMRMFEAKERHSKSSGGAKFQSFALPNSVKGELGLLGGIT